MILGSLSLLGLVILDGVHIIWYQSTVSSSGLPIL